MMSGRPGGYKKYSNLSNLFRNDEVGKLIHYMAPNSHGSYHYPNFNARPRSFYVNHRKRARSPKSKSKKTIIKRSVGSSA